MNCNNLSKGDLIYIPANVCLRDDPVDPRRTFITDVPRNALFIHTARLTPRLPLERYVKTLYDGGYWYVQERDIYPPKD